MRVIGVTYDDGVFTCADGAQFKSQLDAYNHEIERFLVAHWNNKSERDAFCCGASSGVRCIENGAYAIGAVHDVYRAVLVCAKAGGWDTIPYQNTCIAKLESNS